jgi:hypothetical protein
MTPTRLIDNEIGAQEGTGKRGHQLMPSKTGFFSWAQRGWLLALALAAFLCA